jgi:hypothetical protein
MSDDIKDMIRQAMDKNAAEFEDKFNGIMGDKMSNALQASYDSMFGAPQDVAEDPAVEAEVEEETPDTDLETEE